MAAPTYATDLTDILADMPNTTGWTALGGGASGLAAPETDYFVQGSNCISKAAWASAAKGMIFSGGSITVPSGGAVMFWFAYTATNSLAVQTSGGIQGLIGSGSGAYKAWYVSGSDLLIYDVWRPYPVDPTLTADATTGSPTSTLSFFGGIANLPSGGPTKGNPFAIDAMRYGRCTLQVTNGDAGNGYATFSGAESYANNISRRWGLLELISGSYFMQGFLSLGLSGTAVDFRDSNRVIFIRDTKKVASGFNRIEVLNASSNIAWTNISIFALGTTSPGTFIQTAGTVALTSCAFTDMSTFTFLSTATVTGTTFRRCGAITAPGSTLTSCIFDSSTVATDASALVWDVNTDTDAHLDKSQFTKGTNAHHAIQLGTTSPTTVTLRGLSFSGFNASNSQNDSTILVSRTSGTVTINLVGCSGNISYKSAGATVAFIIDPVATALHVQDVTSGSAIQSARVLLQASDGTGPLPYHLSTTITRSGSTATATTGSNHGLTSNDYVVIKGATQPEYNGVVQVTVTGVNTFTYTVSGTPATPATGTILTTGAPLYGLTDSSGNITASRSFASSQPISGWVRKASSGDTTKYKTSIVSGTINNTTGFSATVQLIQDQ